MNDEWQATAISSSFIVHRSSLRRLLPLKRVLAPGVGDADAEDRHEERRLEQREETDLPQRHRPWVEEQRLHIEDDEEQREDVVADVKLHVGRANGFHAALIRIQLDFI